MNTNRNGVDGGYNCRVKLKQILAIVVRKEGCRGDPGDFWMYENGYLLFQGLLSSNSVCWWNNGLNGATKSLVYHGYVNPGALLVGSEPCALEILRNAWARRVLQPPPGYQIVALEDVEHCATAPVTQTQWTPLPEAVCSVILRLSSQGRPAGIETIRESLILAFPHVSPPSEQAMYDTLVQLMKERKLYNTSSGYFIVTPERRRSRSQSRNRKKDEINMDYVPNKSMLMSTEEAMAMVHGDMATVRDGNITHQCIQTNLADVICGGNASDKILYPRTKRRSASFPAPRSPDRRGSFRLWSSSRRLRRSASTRTIAKHYVDTSSSTEYPNSGDSTPTPKKESLLSRLFRRSKRSQCHIGTFSAQFPPTEWFNSKAVHLHNVGTQTSATEKETGLNIAAYLETCDIGSSRSATLPRNHRRLPSGDLNYGTPLTGSRENSPVSRYANSSYATSTLPRKHGYRSRESSRKTSRSSLTKPQVVTEVKVEEKPQETEPSSKFNERLCVPAAESTKTSHRCTTNFSYEENAGSPTDSPVKNLSSIDNSGPSSIESHKSSKTGSSLTSGPSSLESHKTVINKSLGDSPTRIDPRIPKKIYRKDKSKYSPKVSTTAAPKSSMSHSNSFTLQVTTNQNGLNVNNKINASATTAINGGAGGNTKIFVQNCPVRSVITFENGQDDGNPNLVIINGGEKSDVAASASETDDFKPAKNTNHMKESLHSLNNSRDTINNESKFETMNNSRKLSLQLPSRDSLNYHNVIKNVSHNQFNSNSNPDSPIANTFREISKNPLFKSSPPSPTKSFEGISPLSSGKFIKNEVGSKTSLEKSFQLLENGKGADKNIMGSEPNICFKERTLTRENSNHQFPSLSDLSFNFTSLAAQKILKGVSINSVDTLVELNMAANVEKQNNCDVVHTDFGLV
ncbi:stork-head domain-containing protein knockout [Leptinotarsa decemlineata]|uniref:stork-head domain-containing protein knockout n=1 Tax=Leptinotarsa decemlineata TaxID=7539 RepID=UPI003D30BE6B